MAEEKKTKAASVKEILSKESKSEKPKSEAKKVKHRHTHIEHHEDGSHTVRHTPVNGGPEVSYAAPDLDAVHDGLEANVGEPNADEAQGEPAEAPQAQATAPAQGE